MRRYILVIISVIISVSAANAQRAGTMKANITISVRDSSTNAPLGLVTATLTRIDYNKNREVFTYAVSDTLGAIRFNSVPISEYEISLQYMGYFMKIIPNIKIEAKELVQGNNIKDLGVIKLRENAAELNAITVKDHVVPIKYLGDTIQYNAAAYKLSDTDVLEDFFKKLPGWSVDNNGRITANGKVIEQITVNGRIFFFNDPVFVSRNLPAKILKNIKLFEKQSERSKFTGIDDGARTNTVDVAVREDMLNGWLGDVSAGGGTDERYKGKEFIANFNKYNQIAIIGNISNLNEPSIFPGAPSQTNSADSRSYSLGSNLNLSSAKNKYNTDISYNLKGNDNITETDIYRQNFIKDSSFVYESSARKENNTTSHILNGEISRNDKKIMLVIKPMARYTYGNYSNSTNYKTIGGESGIVIKEGESNDSGKRDQESFSTDFQITKRMNKARRTLSLTGKLGFDRSANEGRNRISDESNQRYNVDNNSIKLSTQLSYTEPLTKKMILAGNWGFSTSFSNLNKETFNPDNSGNFTILDPTLSDRSDNTELRQNFDLQLQKPKGKGETSFYMVGVSLMPSYIKRNSEGNNFDKWFVNVTPKAEFRITTPNLLQVFINYKANVRTPDLSQMMPVPDNTDPLYFRMGNKNLKGEYEHSAFMKISKITGSTSSYANGYFFFIDASYFANRIINKSWFDENGVQYSMPFNDGGDYSVQSRLMTNLPFFKGVLGFSDIITAGHYNNISYIDGTRNVTKRVVFGEKADLTINYGDLRVDVGASFNYELSENSIYPGKKNSTWRNSIDGSISYILPLEINFRSDISYQFFSGYKGQNDKPYLLWNANLSKSIIRNKLIATLSARDILNQNKNIQRAVSDFYIQETRYNIVRQYFLFTLTYKFFTGGTTGAFKERVNSIFRNQERNAFINEINDIKR
ncbi:MAG: outer membrane beta-barrel family protein [Bacteroidales bacterium]|nr:outer membrane beta-barrel family protein [Bacteroidales bacterium]